MKIHLFMIGTTTDPRLQSLIDEYRQRLKHYVPFELVVIPDVRNAKSLSQEQLKTAEGEALLSRLTAAMDVILLDEHGREFRSVEFADFLQKKMSSGKDLALVIGGAYGLSAAVKQRANFLLSLSALTFPHQMVRPLLLEQLYRGFTIIHHEPYHNGDDFSAGHDAQRRPAGSAHGRRGFPERKTLC